MSAAMGLPCEDFHFSAGAPAFDAIYEAICDVQGTDVPVTLNRDPSPTLSPNARPDAASRFYAGDSLHLHGRMRHLTIHVTLDNQNVHMIGNAGELLRASSSALEKLGGAVIKRVNPPRRPMTWVELLWTLFILPLAIAAMLIGGLALLVLLSVVAWTESRSKRRERRQERNLRSRLASTGRCMPWPELETRLKSGQGTLIIEHLPSEDRVHEWWTEDDVNGRSQIPLPPSPILVPEGDGLRLLHEYAERCAVRYTDPITGVAKLIEGPAPELKGSRRQLSEKYPRAKIVVLFRFDWDPRRSLICGGQEKRL
jgi:hypothetical protein